VLDRGDIVRIWEGAGKGEDLHEKWFPDGSCAVGGVWTAAFGNVADEFPGSCAVGAGVEVDSRAVVAPAVTGAEDGTCLVAAEGLGQLGEGRLRGETPAVLCVGEVGDPFPACTAVFAFKDGEVGWGGAREGRGGEDGAVGELDVAGVGDALVAGGLVDGVVDEVAEWTGLERRLAFCHGEGRHSLEEEGY